MTTGERIRSMRKKKKLSQGELGRRLGLSTSTISQYERGDIQPSSIALFKIANALECTLNDIADPEDAEKAYMAADAVKHIQYESTSPIFPKFIIEKLNKYIRTHPAFEERLRQQESEIAELEEEGWLVEDFLLILDAYKRLHHTSRRMLSERFDICAQYLDAIASLNEAGIARVVEFINDLAEIPRHKRADASAYTVFTNQSSEKHEDA